MAFMALFGWIFLLLIPIALMIVAVETALTWVVAHVFLVNVILAVLLLLNLLVFIALLKVRARWKREGKLNGTDWKGILVRIILFAGPIWEGLAVLFFLLLLIFQPIPYLANLLLSI